MAAIAASALITRAQRRANMEGGSFVGQAEWIDYLNEGAQKLHEKLVEAYEGEYVSSEATFTTVAGTEDYPLPADFFKLLAIDLNVAGRRLTLRPYPRTERNVYRSYVTGWWRAPRYRLKGKNIRMAPTPDAAYTGTIFYAPLLQVSIHGNTANVANVIVNTDDTVDFLNGYERFIVAYAAIQALKKEESEAGPLETELAKMEREFEDIRESRNADQPLQAVDVEAINLDGILP